MEGSVDETGKAVSNLAVDSASSDPAAGEETISKKYKPLCYHFYYYFTIFSSGFSFFFRIMVLFVLCSARKKELKMKQKEEERRRKEEEKRQKEAERVSFCWVLYKISVRVYFILFQCYLVGYGNIFLDLSLYVISLRQRTRLILV